MATHQDNAAVPANGTASLYVNYFEVAHNRYEFLVELGQYRPGEESAPGRSIIHTRLALSPPYAKMLSDLLVKATTEHERAHGPISSIADDAAPFDVVLHSLPDFEARARQLRAKARAEAGRHPRPANFDPSKRGDAS